MSSLRARGFLVRRAAVLIGLAGLALWRGRPASSGSLGVAVAPTFVAGGTEATLALQPRRGSLIQRGICRGRRCALQAKLYGPLLRRKLIQTETTKKAIDNQVRVWKGSRGLPVDDRAFEKKMAYLRARGLGGKMKDDRGAAPWHTKHVAAGDEYRGTFTSAAMDDAALKDVYLTMTSEIEGRLFSEKGGFDTPVKLRQDHSIADEKGSEERNRDIAAWLFSKFNSRWASPDEVSLSHEEVQHLRFEEVQAFFRECTSTTGFPDEDTWVEVTEDPNKGMTHNEFVKFTTADDPLYLESIFKDIYTGRRFELKAEEISMLWEGDFIKDAPGAIMGLVNNNGVSDGIFELNLVKKTE